MERDNAISVYADADKAEIPFVRPLPQLKVHSGVNSSAQGGVRCECGSCDRGQDSNLCCRKQAAGYEVEVPAAHKVVVIGKLGMEVGRQVRCARVVGSVNLRTKLCVEGKGEDGFSLAHKLLRVLHRRSPYKIIIEVIRRPELGRAGVVEAYVSLGIFAIGEGEIGGGRGYTRPG